MKIEEVQLTPELIAKEIENIAKRIKQHEDDSLKLNFYADAIRELFESLQSELAKLKAENEQLTKNCNKLEQKIAYKMGDIEFLRTTLGKAERCLRDAEIIISATIEAFKSAGMNSKTWETHEAWLVKVRG